MTITATVTVLTVIGRTRRELDRRNATGRPCLAAPCERLVSRCGVLPGCGRHATGGSRAAGRRRRDRRALAGDRAGVAADDAERVSRRRRGRRHGVAETGGR